MKPSPIIFVSLGPGNPELMTLGCYHQLQKADVIVCPSTANKEGKFTSKAAEIITAVGIETEKLYKFHVPMQRKREAALAAYKECADEIAAMHKKGLKITVAVEGDISIYASTQTIAEYLEDAGLTVEMTPGIPSFIAAAAAMAHPLVMGTGSLIVTTDIEQIRHNIERGLQHGSSIVCMKIKSYENEIKEYLSAPGSYECFYYEFLGMGDKEFTTSDKSEIMARSFPYFSSMIIYNPYQSEHNR